MTESAAEAVPPKSLKSKWLKRLLYLCIGTLLGIGIGLHFLPGPMLRDSIQSVMANGGLHVPDPDVCHLSLLTSSAHIEALHIHQAKKKTPLLAFTEISFDPHISSFLFGNRYIVEWMKLEGVSIDLRLPENELGETPTWTEHIASVQHNFQENIRKRKPTSKRTGLLIQHLEISGSSILFPIKSGFDVKNYKITCSNIGKKISDDQQMTINCDFTCADYTHGHVLLETSHHGQSQTYSIYHIPCKTLAQLDVSEGISNMMETLRPTGHFDMHLTIRDHGQQSSGSLKIESKDLILNPRDDQSRLMHTIATNIRELRDLNPKEPMSWLMDWHSENGGTAKKNYRTTAFINALKERIAALSKN